MSLQECPKCKKNIGFWKIYKKLNKNRFSKKHLLKCKKCKSKLSVKIKKANVGEKIIRGLLWMSLPFLLIILVAIGCLKAILAIIIVILYHLLAMFFIIKMYNYNITKNN